MRRRGWALALLTLGVLAAGACTAADTGRDDPSPSASRATGDRHEDGSGREDAGLPSDGPVEGRVPIGARERTRVEYDVETAGSVEQVILSYEPPRFALRAGDRLLIGDGEELVACGVLGDAECVVIDDDAPAEVRDAMLSEGLTPVLAVARAEADPRRAAGTDPTAQWIEQIAERWARCAMVDPPGIEDLEGADVEVCVDARTGVALRWSIEQPDGARTTMEAVDVGLPLPRDFVPRGEAIDPLEDPSDDGLTAAPVRQRRALRSGRSPGRA